MSTKSSIIYASDYHSGDRRDDGEEIHIYHEGLDGKYYLNFENKYYFLDHVPVPDELIKELQLGSKSKYAEVK